jgi:hypothetical protein
VSPANPATAAVTHSQKPAAEVGMVTASEGVPAANPWLAYILAHYGYSGLGAALAAPLANLFSASSKSGFRLSPSVQIRRTW